MYINNQQIIGVYLGTTEVLAIYLGTELLWPIDNNEDILSCYSNGYWIDEYPWTNDTPWKD